MLMSMQRAYLKSFLRFKSKIINQKKSTAAQNVVNNQIYFFNFGDDDDYVNYKKTPFFTSF